MSTVLQFALYWLVAVGSSARARDLVTVSANSSERGWFGPALAGMGDLDGAGDFSASAPRERPVDPASSHGVVRAYSGASVKILFARTGPGGFGDSLACLGDVDGDGLSDFAAGSGWGKHGTGVEVRSGADGSLIYTRIDEAWSGEGRVASVPDVTGDGIDDLLCGWPNGTFFPGSERAPSRVDDLDGDGVPGYAVGAMNDAPSLLRRNREGALSPTRDRVSSRPMLPTTLAHAPASPRAPRSTSSHASSSR